MLTGAHIGWEVTDTKSVNVYTLSVALRGMIKLGQLAANVRHWLVSRVMVAADRPAHRQRDVCVGLGLFVDYLEHRRTFPNQRVNAGPDQSYGLSDHPREGAPHHLTPPRAIHRF